jgi:hypothetical protein
VRPMLSHLPVPADVVTWRVAHARVQDLAGGLVGDGKAVGGTADEGLSPGSAASVGAGASGQVGCSGAEQPWARRQGGEDGP